LQSGESDAVIVGSAHLKLTAEEMFAPVLAGLYSSDGKTRTFDAAASGCAPGEGAIVLVLKRLSDAIASRDRVRAVVRGSAINHNGRTTTFSAPNGPAQADVIRCAIADAGVTASCIDYVEAHGTASLFGDAIEMEALMEVLGSEPSGGRKCAVGCVKTNLGHMEPASGLAGVLKAVLSFEHEAIPPNLHFQRLNPHIRIDGSRFFFPSELTPWPRGPQPRWAGVSSFSLTGSNAHTILEDGPLIPGSREPLPRVIWKRKRHWIAPKEVCPDFAAADAASVAIFIEREARRILHMDEKDPLDHTHSLFADGLDSMGATELSRALSVAANVEFPLRLVFDRPTIQGLAEILQETASSETLRMQSPKRLLLSQWQQYIWSAQKRAPASTAWQFAFCARVRPKPDRVLLERVLEVMENQHESLCVRIVEDSELLQCIAPESLTRLEYVDLSGLPESEVLEHLLANHRRPFNLITGPPWRITLYDHGADESFLLLSMHEIACDQRSFDLLWSDLQQAYVHADSGISFTPASPKKNYKAFVGAQAALAATPRGRQSDAYWSGKLSAPPSLARTGIDPVWMEHRVFLSEHATSRIGRYASSQNATIFMALLATFREVLFTWTGQSDITVCSPAAVPREDRFSSVVGAFTSSFPFRLVLTVDTTFHDVLANVRAAVLEAMDQPPFPSLDACAKFPKFTLIGQNTQNTARGATSEVPKRLLLGDCVLEPMVLPQEGSCPLELQVTVGEPFAALWRYDACATSPDKITAMASLFGTLLEEEVNDPQQRIALLLEVAGHSSSDETLESVEL
jgi:acyl carrier protein